MADEDVVRLVPVMALCSHLPMIRQIMDQPMTCRHCKFLTTTEASSRQQEMMVCPEGSIGKTLELAQFSGHFRPGVRTSASVLW